MRSCARRSEASSTSFIVLDQVAFLEQDNRNLKEYTENLRVDIDSLLRLSCRARDTGVWDPHDLSFCEVTFEQVPPPARHLCAVTSYIWKQLLRMHIM